MRTSPHKWTEEERCFVAEHINDMTTPELARKLNLTQDQITWCFRVLGLKRAKKRKTELRRKYTRGLRDG